MSFQIPRPSAAMRAAIAVAFLSLAPVWSGAARADYPDRIVHLLVPYPAGGPNDVIARLLSQKLGAAWGQQMVVENRAGGAGNIAVEATARAAADGYTIVLPAMAYAVNPALFKRVGYAFEDFAAVSLVTKGPLILVVHPSLGVNSVSELIAKARANPGKIDYGSGGNGSSLHLAAEMFKQEAGVDLQHIPYKGTNDLISDLLSGRVPVGFISPLVAKQLVAEGKLTALGITSPQRSPSWPDTPAVAEAGLPGYSFEAWYAILAPKGTPREVVSKLSKDIAQAVNAPDVRDKLATLGNEAVGSSPEEAERFIAEEARRWEKVLRAANIQVE